MTRFPTCLSLGLLSALAATGPAGAQSRPDLPTAQSLHGGLAAGLAAGRPKDFSLRDGAGHPPTACRLRAWRATLGRVTGVLGPTDGSVGGMADAPLPRAQGQTATAVGNQLVVLATGSWNTIIIDSVQTNTGNVTAATSLTSAKAPQ